MVYFSTPAEINGAFGNMVNRYDYASHAHHPDAALALTLAQLKPGESVLDVGAGGGRFIAAAKQQVGNGFCVAVDALAGFVAQDIPFMLQQKGLAVSPNGNPSTQVHCVRANINDANFATTIPRPASAQQFDCIVAVHLFTTLPPQQRRPAYVRLRRLLKPSGRLIVNMSARFTDSTPLSSESHLPVQFRTSPYTESPGAHLVSEFRITQDADTDRVMTDRGGREAACASSHISCHAAARGKTLIGRGDDATNETTSQTTTRRQSVLLSI
ncbi:hypothetical protein IQ06DRAFT_341271 [Phaeosphaeriaceae sp. SRC1lsM3a]|nr:hypothetical protein IQ06DRAFT_341271 [Stagonospora sp. SRC1lsM3a]